MSTLHRASLSDRKSFLAIHQFRAEAILYLFKHPLSYQMKDDGLVVKTFKIQNEGYTAELLRAMKDAPALSNPHILAVLAEPQLQAAEIWDRFAQEFETQFEAQAGHAKRPRTPGKSKG